MAAEAHLAHSIASVGSSLLQEISPATASFGHLHLSASRTFIPRASDSGASLENASENQESPEHQESVDAEWPQLRSISVGLVDDTVAMLDRKCDSRETKVVRLLLALGLGKQQVAQAISSDPDVLQLSVVDILARLRVLLDLGSSLGEVASSLVREPRWLHSPVQRIYDMVAYLESLGVERDKVHRVLLRFPRIMELSESEITPSLAKLQYIVGEGRDIYRMIERQPRVLGLSQAQITETVEVLKQFIAAEQVADVLLKKPLVLLMSRDAIVQRIQYLASIFHKHRLSNVFKVAPGLLTIDTKRLMRQYSRLEMFLDPAATDKLVNAFPQALTLSWEKVLLPKFRFLEELGLDRFEVLNFPAYLGYSLDSRIRPRCAVLLAAGYAIRAHDEVITTDNERRLRKFGRSHHEILQTFGSHAVCIQHIVGLTDADFHSQFGVSPSSASASSASSSFSASPATASAS
ncbi:unnamed protein product [Closterium sp. NIES-65]|nr:unnamed protein product [Closterium sp. NIES-65]CAI6010723.1 unnamed protein product [Closterium sp. NIES-65]